MNHTKPERADLEKVIDKVRKLLALGSSPNEHEAALAVSKAQALLEQYDLTMESVEDLKSDKRTSIRRGDLFNQSLGTEGKTDGWKFDLFSAVAHSFDCFTDYSSEMEETPGGKWRAKKVGKFIGFAHDVEMAHYALSFLIHEIERLAQAYADIMWAEIKGYRDANGLSQHEAESLYTKRTGRHPLKAKLYFTKGAAQSVSANLYNGYHERQKAADSNPHAIVLRNKKAAVEDFIYMERYGRTKEEQRAIWDEQDKKYQESLAPKAKPTETPEQARRRKEKEDRYWQKRNEAWQRQREREEAASDRVAVRDGLKAGSEIRINPGLNKGQAAKEIT